MANNQYPAIGTSPFAVPLYVVEQGNGNEYPLPGAVYIVEATTASATVVFRRTLSPIGTRVGSRQMQGA